MKLLLTGAYSYSEKQKNTLKSLGYEIFYVQNERIPLQIDMAEIDAVVCNSLFMHNDIHKFKNLKFIQLTSSGLERVPLEYIKDHGISLFNAKGVYSIPMAEWVILKILEIYKKSKQFYIAQQNHKWEKQKELFELTGKTVAIIGFGDIGREIAKRIKVFGVKVVAVGRRHIESNLIDEYYLIDNLKNVLKQSDIIVLTLPYTNETHHLLDIQKLELIKDNSVLINISRGRVIDEAALIETLYVEKFLGVALDVFEEEPLSGRSKLWEFDRLIITPHNSYQSNKVNERLFKVIETNLRILIRN